MRVLVVGAAGGVGTATCERFLARGANVVGVDQAAPSQRLKGRNGYQHVVHDITDVASFERSLAAAGIRELDHVVVATGGALPAEVDEDDPSRISTEVFTAALQLNLVLPYLIVRTCRAPLLNSPGPNRSILIASSVNALGDFGYPAYSAAKAGLSGLVRSLCRPLGREGIRIGLVSFGTVLTEASLALYEDNPDHNSGLLELSSLGRFVTAEEAGDAFVAAALDLPSATGFTLVVDAGQSLPGNHTD